MIVPRYNQLRLPLLRRLLGMLYGIERLTVPRVDHVRRRLTPILAGRDGAFRLADFGCGLADHLFYYAARHRRAAFVGVDHQETNVLVSRAYQRLLGLDNVDFVHADLSTLDISLDADVALCLSVLQYVDNLDDALRGLGRHLTRDGVLVLYQDVHDSRTRGVTTAIEGARQYTTAEVSAGLTRTGFTIEQQACCEGVMAQLATGAIRGTLTAMKRNTLVGSALAVPLVLASPLVLLGLWLDARMAHRSGAALLVIARRNAVNSTSGEA